MSTGLKFILTCVSPMATRKFDSEAVPSWQDGGYKLEDGTPLGISHSLWDEISGREANAATIFSGTPVSHVPEVSPAFYSSCSQGCSGDASLDVTGSPRPKRRRMLEYPDARSAYKSDFQQQIEYQVESSQESTFTSAPQVYGYQNGTSFSSYSYPHAGAGASRSDVTASTAEQAWLTTDSPHQQLVLGEIFQQGNAWFDQVHRHTPLHQDLTKFPNEEVDHCEFLAERPWADQEVEVQPGQADRRVEQVPKATTDVNYRPHMNPAFVSALHSPGFKIFQGGSVCDDKRVQGVRTPLPGTPGSNISIQQKPQAVTPLPLCPFDVVKPLPGVEGNMTLEDINQRISTHTSLPGHHSVSADKSGRLPSTSAEDRSRPTSSETGIGLSGKSVVSLRTIHTQGSGTLTIIRTKD